MWKSSLSQAIKPFVKIFNFHNFQNFFNFQNFWNFKIFEIYNSIDITYWYHMFQKFQKFLKISKTSKFSKFLKKFQFSKFVKRSSHLWKFSLWNVIPKCICKIFPLKNNPRMYTVHWNTYAMNELHSYNYICDWPEKTGLISTQNTPIHIMAPISYSVYATQNL